MSDPKRPQVHAPNCVTIFGAGITGLTVAHELVERGFRVQVWERQADERRPYHGCDVGGMARTQWSRVEWREETSVDTSPHGDAKTTSETAPAVVPEPGPASDPVYPDLKGRQTQPIRTLPQTFFVTKDETKILGFDENGKLTTDGAVSAIGQAYQILMDCPYINFVYCEVQRRRGPNEVLDKESIKKAVAAFNEVIKQLPSAPHLQNERETEYRWQRMIDLALVKGRVVNFAVVSLDGFPDDVPADYDTRISFRVRERWLPGEHGFRFFPSFYHHLFDTMKRTPILEAAPKLALGAAQERSVTVNADPQKYVESGRTAYDNLQPTTKTALGMTRGGQPRIESRFAPASLEDIRQWLRLFFGARSDARDPLRHQGPSTRRRDEGTEADDGGGFGCTFRDAAIYQVKVLKYLTSCQKRREEYEQMSWFDFLGGPQAYSQNFVDMTNKWPQALVAMSATEVDARSQGSASVQFLLDNFRPAGYRDGTLVGPTSVAWLQHWRRYLEAQGVEFIHGELKGITSLKGSDGERPWPLVDCYEPRYPMNEEGQPALMPGYFVLALPVIEASRIARESGLSSDEGDFEKAAGMVPDEGDARTPNPKGPLRHMIGLQYYFDEDLSWFDGHIYFPNSDWGISGISQIRFWQDRPDWEHGYRGILSVIFSMTKGEDPQNEAWKSSPGKIATKVWDQVSKALPNLPKPIRWHIDGNVVFKADDKGVEKGVSENKSPYLINPPNQWQNRPGRINLPPVDGTEKPAPVGYEVNNGFVFAGTYMKTTTRLTTMEAANESGRHAANGILWDCQEVSAQTFCDIWPLEEREVDDFRVLKDLDAELYSRGLDHFVDILELDTLAANSLRGGPQDPFDPLGVLRGMRGLIDLYGKALIATLDNPNR